MRLGLVDSVRGGGYRGLVLSVTACYGQFVPGDKEVEEMTIELASARRATRLVG